MDHTRKQRQAKVLRVFRKVHRTVGAILFVFFFLVSVSGLLLFKTRDEQIKLFYTSTMGLALLTFTITGFWLLYGPKRMRAETRSYRDEFLSEARIRKP